MRFDKRNRIAAALALAGAFWAAQGAALAQDLLVRGGRVVTLAGETHEAGSVLIRGGKIAAVGEKLSAPGVPVLEAGGRIVMPSFVVPHTNDGMDRSNERMPVTPFVSVRDGIDPSQTYFENSLRDGHLALLVMPGPRTVIGGQGLVVQPYGLTVDHMSLKDDVGMKISMLPVSGSRAEHFATMREALDKAKLLYENAQAKKGEDLELTGNWEIDLEKLAIARQQWPLIRMLKGDLPAYIDCGNASDVVRALRLAKEYGLKPRLVVRGACVDAAKTMAEQKVPVVLLPPFEYEKVDAYTGERETVNAAKVLHDAGVPFAVTTRNSLGERYQWYQAASLVRAGLDRKDALAAVTSRAAAFAGMGDRLGSLEPGKDGTLVIWTTDPLSGRAWVEAAVCRGEVVYRRTEDPRLREVFGEETR